MTPKDRAKTAVVVRTDHYSMESPTGLKGRFFLKINPKDRMYECTNIMGLNPAPNTDVADQKDALASTTGTKYRFFRMREAWMISNTSNVPVVLSVLKLKLRSHAGNLVVDNIDAPDLQTLYRQCFKDTAMIADDNDPVATSEPTVFIYNTEVTNSLAISGFAQMDQVLGVNPLKFPEVRKVFKCCSCKKFYIQPAHVVNFRLANPGAGRWISDDLDESTSNSPLWFNAQQRLLVFYLSGVPKTT